MFSSHTLNRYLLLPKVGIPLLLLAIVLLLWILQRGEEEEARHALITDVLWLEQDLRFRLTSTQEQLQQLATLLGEKPLNRPESDKRFNQRAAQVLKNTPEISHLFWLDDQLQTLSSLPPGQHDWQAASGMTGTTATVTRLAEQAIKLGKPVYGEPWFAAPETGTIPSRGAANEGPAMILLLVPVFHAQQAVGVLLALYPLQGLLQGNVPWWFAQKYQVRLVDDAGTVFSSKSQVQGEPGQRYDLPFDTLGQGIRLQVLAYPAPGNPLLRLLAALIILLSAGVLWSLWGVRNQIQKRMQTEQALRAEHAFRKAMEDSLTVGMRARDLNGQIIYVNPAFCRMTGFSQTELIARMPPMPYWAPEEIDATLARHRAVLAGHAPPDGFEVRLMRKNGERFDALIYEAPLIDGNGYQTGWMGSVLDVTERKRTEALARQQQEKLQFTSRLVTMGEMASTLAHELNQPLAAIASYNTGCLNLLQTGLAQGQLECRQLEMLQQALNKLGIQAQRAGKIIRRVHHFVRKSEPKQAPCPLVDVLEDCIGFMDADIRKYAIRLLRDIDPGLPAVLADRVMLEQVVLNLMRNAVEAMCSTPTLPAPVRYLKISARHDVSVGLPGRLVVRIADNGPGIPVAQREQLFSAFFSTKEEGMGIGLSICRSIIEFHRGQLWLAEEPENGFSQGCCFVFTLPVPETLAEFSLVPAPAPLSRLPREWN